LLRAKSHPSVQVSDGQACAGRKASEPFGLADGTAERLLPKLTKAINGCIMSDVVPAMSTVALAVPDGVPMLVAQTQH
jgi:hypothetical protein